MEKHKVVLEGLFYSLQDDLKDAWRKYDDFKKCKEHNELEMARFFLTDSKARVEHAELVKEKIDYYMTKNNLVDDSMYKTFYHNTLDMIEDLKMRLNKIVI